MRMRVYVVAGLAALSARQRTGCSRQAAGSGDVEWRAYAGDRGSSKYAPLDQINKDNVAQLKIAWRRPAVDSSLAQKKPDLAVPRDFRATPLMVSGTLFSSNGIGLVEAFQPATGRTIWVQEPFADEPEQGLSGRQHAQRCVLGRWECGPDLRHPRRVSDRARFRTQASRLRTGAMVAG